MGHVIAFALMIMSMCFFVALTSMSISKVPSTREGEKTVTSNGLQDYQ